METKDMPLRLTLGITALLFASAAVAAVVAGGTAARAADRQKFELSAFSEAQKAGKSIIVHVSAPWCPTCKAQKPIMDGLAASADFKDVVVLEIDFDTGSKDWKPLNVRSQSTLIGFKGEKETGRSAGDTRKESIEALFRSTL